MTKEDLQVRNVLSVELVAAYVRVSTQEQKLHGLSLDAQKMKLTEYAEKNNMKIVEWYVDEGVSGRKLIRNRPELQRMIVDAESRKFDRIIFIKLDRFFRSVAEYHECMKRIAPVVWSTTEEEYDLTTANGRMLVNMKLTIAEMEADLAGERISIVNDYKVSTGQPLSGKLPFGFAIAADENTGKKKVIKDPELSPVVEDIINHYLTHQSKRKTVIYLNAKYHLSVAYNTLSLMLSNTMLYGEYRGNPSYCEAYLDKDTFDRIQEIIKRNIKDNTAQKRAYLFSGLILCPECGCKLKGTHFVQKYKSGKGILKKYRCTNNSRTVTCSFNKVVAEKTMERKMLAGIEHLFEEAKIRAFSVDESGDSKPPKYDIEAINTEIDRLNYSWQTGKIRTVEKYEEQYAELLEKLERAEEERGETPSTDFSKVETILRSGWESIYDSLDDEHKRAFWRSFIESIKIEWTTETKRIKRVNFF